tara:strand:+ start:461 stop:754 length:294 start_codon:yes stop_codon:yes gene_type:complete
MTITEKAKTTLREYLYNYPIITIMTVIFANAMVMYATFQVFNNMTEVTTEIAACYATLFGFPGVAYGFYQWRMGQQEKRIKKEAEVEIVKASPDGLE